MERFRAMSGRGYPSDFFRGAKTPEGPQEVSAVSESSLRSFADNALPLAMSYVPIQEWKDIYEAECGFGRGTIFYELYLPLGTLNRGGGSFER